MFVDVTVEISTKDRYEHLQHCLLSVALQSVSPKEVLIFDDGLGKDLRKNQIYSDIFSIFNRKGIKWAVLEGCRKGQVANHQAALDRAETEYVWRLDDDNYAETDVLQKLMQYIDVNEGVGAIASCVLHPSIAFPSDTTGPLISDSLFYYASQFARFDGYKSVEHLYSTFLYRKTAAKPYPNYLSRVGHREETIFSHEILRNGYELIVLGDAITWHMQASQGGIRMFSGNSRQWDDDETIYLNKLKEWGVKLNSYKLLINELGIGDNYVLKNLLLEIKDKFQDSKILLGTVYPSVYYDESDLNLISLHSAKILAKGKSLSYNPYEYLNKKKWNKPLVDGFREFYLEKSP